MPVLVAVRVLLENLMTVSRGLCRDLLPGPSAPTWVNPTLMSATLLPNTQRSTLKPRTSALPTMPLALQQSADVRVPQRCTLVTSRVLTRLLLMKAPTVLQLGLKC